MFYRETTPGHTKESVSSTEGTDHTEDLPALQSAEESTAAEMGPAEGPASHPHPPLPAASRDDSQSTINAQLPNSAQTTQHHPRSAAEAAVVLTTTTTTAAVTCDSDHNRYNASSKGERLSVSSDVPVSAAKSDTATTVSKRTADPVTPKPRSASEVNERPSKLSAASEVMERSSSVATKSAASEESSASKPAVAAAKDVCERSKSSASDVVVKPCMMNGGVPAAASEKSTVKKGGSPPVVILEKSADPAVSDQGQLIEKFSGILNLFLAWDLIWSII